MQRNVTRFATALAVGTLVCGALSAAPQEPPRGGEARPGGPPGGGGPGGPGGFPGGPMGQERKLVKEHDQDGDGKLNREERAAARAALKEERAAGGRGGPGGGRRRGGGFGPPGMREEREPPKPGKKVAPSDVKSHAKAALYDPTVLRTIFLDFEGQDWEAELADFSRTDVEVPATMTVDGKKYPGVGVSFRGASSLFGVGEGFKRSLGVSVDHTDGKQRLGGYKNLNLLNSHEDASFLHTVLYSRIARTLIPAPQSNFVRVVINGESWGLYVNAQQFDRAFLAENYPSAKGARWKVQGSPGGRGGLEYTGDDPEPYQRRYTLKSGGGEEAWPKLVALCKTLNETPLDHLEAALAPIFDIEAALRFLAIECVLVNNDGYWVRASDYGLFLDEEGVFHIVPHDMNETFALGGMGMGPGGRGRGGRGPGGAPGGPPGGGAAGGGEPRGRPEGGSGGPPPGEGGGERRGAPGEGPAPRPGAEPGPGGDAPPRPRGEGAPPGGQPGGEGGPPAGPGQGFRGPPRGGGAELDPLVGLDDPTKPLRSRLLAVPSLRARYLKHVKKLAEESLDWKKLGPVVKELRTLIEKEVEADTRKLSTFEAFEAAVSDTAPPAAAAPPAPEAGAPPGGGRRPAQSLRAFADRRRAFLLAHPEVKSAQD